MRYPGLKRLTLPTVTTPKRTLSPVCNVVYHRHPMCLSRDEKMIIQEDFERRDSSRAWKMCKIRCVPSSFENSDNLKGNYIVKTQFHAYASNLLLANLSLVSALFLSLSDSFVAR